MKKLFIYSIFLSIGFCACKTSKQSVTKPSSMQEKAATSSTGGIILNNGQKITVTSVSSAVTDMGMGMEMKNSSSATNVLLAISSDEKNYTISNTMTKFALEFSMMGKEENYDSEDPSTKDSEIGKGAAEKLNVPDTALIDRMTGSAIEKKAKSPEREKKGGEDNPFAGMMEALGGSTKDVVLESAFFVLPKDKKMGDSWTDSSSKEQIKTVKTYTLKSIDNNIATIQLKTTITGNGQSEMDGNTISFTMDNKSTGDMIVDTKTSLVNKVTTESDISMTMDIMGQSMPITSKVNSTVSFQH